MARLALALGVLVAACCCLAPTARAADYCVAPNTSCGGTNVATFEEALGAADDADDSDRIFLGTTIYTAAASTGFAYNRATGPVEIVGAGRGATVLTGQIGGMNSVLDVLAGAGSSVHDLTIRLPQNAGVGLAGLQINRLASRIEVVEALTQSNFRTGVRLSFGSLEDSTVTIGDVQNNIGVHAFGGSIRNSTIESRPALFVDAPATLERLRLRGVAVGLDVSASTTITDSLIQVSGGTAILARPQPLQNTTLNTDGLTMIGGTGSRGALASTSTADAQDATVNLANAVLRGFDQALVTAAPGTGEADINASFSDYDPSGNSDTGPGDITPSNVTNVGDARFVNTAGGDFRLGFDSPLIDTGEPGPANSATDLAGGLRLVDGDAVPGARRDIGAYEYQALAPVASISGPATAATGEQLSFSGAGSSDPDGDGIVFAWTLDGAPAGSGPTLSASFQTAGTHTVGLTVTDPTGRQGSATQTVTVSDVRAPVISELSARPARVRRGRPVNLRFRLSEAASVRVKIQRALPGRRVRGRCRKPSARNRSARRCTRYVRVTTLRATGKAGKNRVRFSGRVRGRALARGRYRAVVQATDAAGNHSVPRRVSFRVLAG